MPRNKKFARKQRKVEEDRNISLLDERRLIREYHTPSPRKHPIDLKQGNSWRIFKIMSEFVEGFQLLSTLRHEVTVFGSARTKPTDKWYKEARKLGQLLAKHDYTVITGGGGGIMEAANRGAYEAGGASIGLNIQLPREQKPNPYTTKSMEFHYFFSRKVMLNASSQAFIYFPGGFGTMDELFEMITLMQTGRTENIPAILVGRKFWKGMISWIEKVLEAEEYQTVSLVDLKMLHVVDTAEETFNIIKETVERADF